METLTDAQIEEVLQRLQEGKGVAEIARELELPSKLRSLIPDERKEEYDLAVRRAVAKRKRVRKKAEEADSEPFEESEESEWPEPVKAEPYSEPEPEPKPKPKPKSKPKPESKSKPVSEHEDIVEEVAKRPAPKSEVVKEEKPQEKKKDASRWEHPIVIAGMVLIGGVALFMLIRALNDSKQKQRKVKTSKRQIGPMDSREMRYKALAERYKVM